MNIARLRPILTKESILKTANAAELEQAPNDVLERYTSYALTHVPLGDTSSQLSNLERVITQNKHCAVGTIVGPYGYGKTSTAVHLWKELRDKHILSVPPFQWNDLEELMKAVYHWTRFEFSLGPQEFMSALDRIFERFSQRELETLRQKYDDRTIEDLAAQGRLRLGIRPQDIVDFYQQVCELCKEAGYNGLAVFTDELQATVAAYQPSRDQFYADLFQIVKDILGLPGQWTLILTMDPGTEGIIARDRADMLQRMQRSALYFRVEDVYNRREYPAELWAAFEQRFGFDGSAVLPAETLESIGQIAARKDLGAGPRMVTHAFVLAIQHYTKRQSTYQPLHFVNDFLDGQMVFDQRGKFREDVNKALQNPAVAESEEYQRVIKLLAAYPMGCEEETLAHFGLLDTFKQFPPLARRELIARVAGGYILRYLAEEEIEPEQIEQRLTNEFVNRFSPTRGYAEKAADGFMQQVLLEPTFAGKSWKVKTETQVNHQDTRYRLALLEGTFDSAYPDRLVAVSVAAVPQSNPPVWRRLHADADLELRFELNYRTTPSEPNGLLIAPERPEIAVFQLNVSVFDQDLAERQLPDFLFDYYTPQQLTPLLALSFIEHLDRNSGELPDDRYRVVAVVNPLRQYVLSTLLNERLECYTEDFVNKAVGTRVIEDLFAQLCRRLYPNYRTLITGRKWRENLQQYGYALQTVINEDGISIVRGRRPWDTTKEAAADAFRIPGRRLNNLDNLLEILDPLIERIDYAGRTPTSPVQLRFGLHPLEQEWLERIDASTETVRLNGNEPAPAVPAEDLLRSARHQGYRDDEIQEILRLLQTRKYIDHDPRSNMLVRTIDNIVDLKEAVAAQIERIAEQVSLLSAELPDFNAGLYPVSTLRQQLEDAGERDEVEILRSEVREVDSRLRSFLSSRSASLREKLNEDLKALHGLVQQGIPAWLGEEFPSSPLKDLLEMQRTSMASSYRNKLEEIERLRMDALQKSQASVGTSAEDVTQLYQQLREITDEGRRLQRQLETYVDRQNDLKLWRRVLDNSVAVRKYAQLAEQKYGNASFRTSAEELWQQLRRELETQPLAVLDLHTQVNKKIAALGQDIKAWLDNRREDFLLRCRACEQLLSQVDIDIALNIPFDSERPTESYKALQRGVQNRLRQELEDFSQRLNRDAQVVHYGIQVQHLSLEDADQRIRACQNKIPQLQAQVDNISVEDIDPFKTAFIKPLALLRQEERAINDEVQRALQRREPEGSEIRLMDLLSRHASAGRVDLRSLILQLLEQGEGEVNVEQLMDDLQSLFQKNQITIHINLLGKQ